MREGPCWKYNQLPSLRDADKPEYPQISNLWRVRLADLRDMDSVRRFYGDAPHLHVHFPGLRFSPMKRARYGPEI